MVKIKIVFLDMDGVITDFVRRVCEAFGKPNPYPDLTRGYSFWHAWPDVDFEQVNAICNQEFWHYQEWTSDGREILRAIYGTLKTIGLKDVYFVTYPMPNPEACTGKWLWVRDNLPMYLKRLIITQAPKSLLARPNTLLIDDRDENVEMFREAGGSAILVPRPWNKLYCYSNVSSQIVRKELEKYEAVGC